MKQMNKKINIFKAINIVFLLNLVFLIGCSSDEKNNYDQSVNIFEKKNTLPYFTNYERQNYELVFF